MAAPWTNICKTKPASSSCSSGFGAKGRPPHPEKGANELRDALRKHTMTIAQNMCCGCRLRLQIWVAERPRMCGAVLRCCIQKLIGLLPEGCWQLCCGGSQLQRAVAAESLPVLWSRSQVSSVLVAAPPAPLPELRLWLPRRRRRRQQAAVSWELWPPFLQVASWACPAARPACPRQPSPCLPQ